jgi:TolA-binding protein
LEKELIMKKLILALLLVSQASAAATQCADFLYLSQGSQTPCSGFLFSDSKELEVRTKILDNKRLNELTQKQDELISVLNQQIDNQTKQNNNLRNDLNYEQNKGFWSKALSFALGVVITGLIVRQVK